MQNIQSQSHQSRYDKAYVRQNKQTMDDSKSTQLLAELKEQLVKVANQRDKQAYAELFSYFAPKILNFGNQKLTSQGLAMDLVQETMTTVWTKAHLFDADKGSVTTWVFTIMRNRCFDMLRKVQHNKEDTFGDDIWPVFESPQAEEQEDHILTAKMLKHVDALPPLQRQVVKGIYLQELSQQELSTKLSVPLGTIKSRLRLGLVKLRSILEKHYD
ncbi:sigma-70 family RNA polymerase sigma factor [Shewanella fidelis]|uniref:Sigma-70 family RNA polymerase sigma factor n=2 Tax=Shewanella fidelis TaxID=173509 RepID=A0AAW8NMX1_9GAMM|nr:sigma-70 family RNA polymerase sigma factor [Shewanella fidelis]MDR8523635.1 sigma-70 family RNA polymerase sigma factor [Shewanella fidelis]MDW4810182.1 sigma-70 family RNA polymerase sigma factor [Shewanella fidelis]MDW4814327.1 sigma-70 family RNA polymerase sigma factor [Shewanella fidelis]MDW4818418.1 sigma-70 family RNA polymerase sigma factor [Shewanella fidelis]MDW4823930.1 sigma-70 family RNA polymerase sigma factor [Shewanella fidelis]